MDAEPVILTKEQVLAMLPEGTTIHTFRSTGLALIGCDWDREQILEAIENNVCELGGPGCQKINHGLAIHVDGPLFVECKKGFDYSIFEPVASAT